MISFDREIGICLCATKLWHLFKLPQNSSANKVARGVLSPIQAKDLGLVFA